MSKQPVTEIWREVKFDFKYTNNVKIEVSSFGRVRSTTKQNGETILKGAMVSGYRIVRLKFFKQREQNDSKRIEFLREQMAKLVKQTGKLRTRNKAKRVKDTSYYEYEKKIKSLTELLDQLKTKYKKELRAVELSRTINYGGLVHRLVAENFVTCPSAKHILVAHLDYDKLNNRASNLRWMTREENVEHQKLSPYVIEAKKSRFGKRLEGTKPYKLTSTKVMLIKKKINEGVPLRTLAKTFKVTETQMLRIKRGENWGNIQAAR